MAGPYDYSLGNIPDPSQSFLQGLQTGNGIQQLQVQQQQQQAAIAQQQQQAKVINSLISKPNPTADDYARATLVVPGLREHFKQSWDMHNTEQQQSSLAEIGQVHAALTAGQPQYAVDLLRNRATALKNSGGPPEQIQAAENMASVIEQNPAFARSITGMKLASIPGGDKVLTNLGTLGQEDRAAAKAPADLRTANAGATVKEAEASVALPAAQEDLRTKIWGNANTKSQIEDRAARLGLDKDKLTTETQLKLTELNQKLGQLPDDARKLVNESAVTAVASEQAVTQYQDLAGRLDALGGSWGSGAGSSAGEWLARATGNEDAVSAMKREYTRMASQGVIKLLPPGPASDKDIAIAKEGIPNANASPTVVASYLRGMAKLSAYDAVLNNAKAEWGGAVQHLGKTKTDIEIDGVKVPAGATFSDFARQYLAKKADALNAAATIPTRGYMKYAAPAAPAAPVTPPGGGMLGAD